jgi:hypothetical protein
MYQIDRAEANLLVAPQQRPDPTARRLKACCRQIQTAFLHSSQVTRIFNKVAAFPLICKQFSLDTSGGEG